MTSVFEHLVKPSDNDLPQAQTAILRAMKLQVGDHTATPPTWHPQRRSASLCSDPALMFGGVPVRVSECIVLDSLAALNTDAWPYDGLIDWDVFMHRMSEEAWNRVVHDIHVNLGVEDSC